MVELVGRVPLMFTRVENGVTKKLPKKNAKILDQKQQFSMGKFHFLVAEKSTFGGGYDFKTGSPVTASWGIYKHAPTAFWRKRRVFY